MPAGRARLGVRIALLACLATALLHPGRFAVLWYPTVSDSELQQALALYRVGLAGPGPDQQDNTATLTRLARDANRFSADGPAPGCSPTGLCGAAGLPLVTVVVPARDRATHAAVFLPYIHQFLSRQALHYTVIIVQQEDRGPFNRARLLNIGFTEARKMRPHSDCFIFHDIDLIPVTSENWYVCLAYPRHM